jgi:lantibiotic modifying enzyme
MSDEEPVRLGESIVVRVADRLRHLAIRRNSQCNWICENSMSQGRARALGPDFYSGLAGVAHFVNAAASVSGEEDHVRLARGALLAAFDQIDRGRIASTRTGLYSGTLGVALAALDVGTGRNDQELFVRGCRLLEAVLSRLETKLPRSSDIISGVAGCICGLAYVVERWSGVLPPDLQSRSGEARERCLHALLSAAELASEGGLIWPLSDSEAHSMGSRHLLGFAHGTAGVLFALCGEARTTEHLQSCVRGAMTTLRERFVEGRGWPDLRSLPNKQQFSDGWCHGTLGVSLSLQRVLPFDHRLAEFCRRKIGDWISQVNPNSPLWELCLCHGVAGGAFLTAGAEESDAPEEGALDGRVFRGIREWLRRENDNGSCDISQMTGLAGLGSLGLLSCGFEQVWRIPFFVQRPQEAPQTHTPVMSPMVVTRTGRALESALSFEPHLSARRRSTRRRCARLGLRSPRSQAQTELSSTPR